MPNIPINLWLLILAATKTVSLWLLLNASSPNLSFGVCLDRHFENKSAQRPQYLSLLRGYSTPLDLIFKDFAHFLKNKATLDKVSYGSGQKCFKELKKHSFTSVETIVVKLV